MERLIQTALQEEGYLEKKSNADLDSKTKNAGDKNYTKYWRDLCPSLQANYWCAAFVAWCFQKAYGRSMALKLLCAEKTGYSYYTPTMANYFKAQGRFFTSNPQRGDVIFFKNASRICHVGVIIKVDSKYVYTIEGNTSSTSGVVANGGSVSQKRYLLTNSRIAGYGRPNYALLNGDKVSNPYPEPSKLLKKGSKGEDVKWLQYELNESGYNLKVDGEFGQLTHNALIDFQEKFKLEIDGVCGKQTRNKLKLV